MPLESGEPFDIDVKVLEHYQTEVDGEYRLERYKVLSIKSGLWPHAFIFYINDEEVVRRIDITATITELIAFYFKLNVLNIYPMVTYGNTNSIPKVYLKV